MQSQDLNGSFNWQLMVFKRFKDFFFTTEYTEDTEVLFKNFLSVFSVPSVVYH
jgi:hypothetical protein